MCSSDLSAEWCRFSAALAHPVRLGAVVITSSWGAAHRRPGPLASPSSGVAASTGPSTELSAHPALLPYPGLPGAQLHVLWTETVSLGGRVTQLLEMPLAAREIPQASRNKTYLVPL